MLPTRAQVRTVLRNLRYASLSHCIGQQFRVGSAESLGDDVAHLALSFALTATPEHDVKTLYLQIAKYRILLLGFSVRPDAFDVQYRHGKQLIRELGYGEKLGAEDDDLTEEFAMLGQLAEDIAKDNWHFLLYCEQIDDRGQEAVSFWDRVKLTQAIEKSGDLRQLPLPGEFEIKDACCTNTSFAWLAKHFFL